MKKTINILFILGFLFPTIVEAQFYNRNTYRTQRNEISFGLGASSCLTDLGGGASTDSSFFGNSARGFLFDLNTDQTKYVVNFSYMYYLKSKITFRINLAYSKISGDDNSTSDPDRNNRKLNFETTIVEGSGVVEWILVPEKSGNRYVEFCLADSNLDYATDLDIYIQGGLHSDMSYDIIAYEDLEGSLFEDDKRFLHRIGRVKQESIENLSIGRTALYKRGNPVFSESNKRFKHRKIKEFEASILSKEVLIWLASGEIDYEKIEFDIEIVKGLSSMKRRHNKITDQQFPFEQIKIPYINHLWKLNSTYKDNLIITSDIELEEEKELVIVNKLDNSEIRLEVGFYNEDL